MKPVLFSVLILFAACKKDDPTGPVDNSVAGATVVWEQTSGPSGGAVWSLAVSGTNLFVGTADSGLFRSTDQGTSWTKVNPSLTNLGTGVWVLGTNLFTGTGGGVFLSTNNGTSWTAANTGLPSTNSVFALVVSGTNLFAGINGGGVFLSTNNGTSWTAVNTGLTTLNIMNLAVSGTDLFAGTEGYGVFRSTNNGTSWTSVSTGLPEWTGSLVPIKAISGLAVSGTNLFAGTFDAGVYRSTNNGTSWTAVNTGLTNVQVQTLAVSGANLLAGTGNGIFVSTNNGTSWTAANTGFTTAYGSYVLAFAVSGTTVYAGTIGTYEDVAPFGIKTHGRVFRGTIQ